MTTTTDQRLYGPPGAEVLGYDPHDAAQCVLDYGWEPAEPGEHGGSIVIEEWTTHDPASFLPDIEDVAEFLADYPEETHDETLGLGRPYLDVWEPITGLSFNPEFLDELRPHVEAIRSLLVARVDGHVAKDHVATWSFPVVWVESWKCQRCRRSFSIPLGAPECQDHRPEKEIEHELGVPTRTEVRS